MSEKYTAILLGGREGQLELGGCAWWAIRVLRLFGNLPSMGLVNCYIRRDHPPAIFTAKPCLINSILTVSL